MGPFSKLSYFGAWSLATGKSCRSCKYTVSTPWGRSWAYCCSAIMCFYAVLVCGHTMNIREMLNQTTNKFFRFEDLGMSRTISYYDGADYGSTMPLGDYEVMDTYVERFLVVHTLLPGEKLPRTISNQIHLRCWKLMDMRCYNAAWI